MAANKILIVDDDVDLVEAYKLYLESKGLEVFAAHSAADGLKLLETLRPDLISADLMLEHHDSGFSFCNKVRKHPALAKVPLIMLTGVLRETGMDFSTETREERSWIKADEVIAKPVSPQQFFDIVRRHLATAHA